MKSIPDASEETIQALGCRSWSTWGCGVSVFPWTYADDELCLILEGDVVVTDKATGEQMRVKAGDIAFFPKGMSCEWNVSESIHKHFIFGVPLA